MARNSTNADWWSTLGVIRTKAVLTFADDTFVEVFSTDYIKSWKLVQDLASGNDKPVFDFVSDRLEMTLYNLDHDFNPNAESSQYYGKFTLGTRIELSVKVDYLGKGDELNWDVIGEYRIAEIDVSDNGTECYILAYDSGYDSIEHSKQQIIASIRDITGKADVEAFFADVFPAYTVSIQEGISSFPLKLFPLSTKLDTINEFLAAMYCFSRCSGNNIDIRSFDDTQRAILDRSNIVSLSAGQSVVKQYKSSVVKWNEIGAQSGTEIVSLTAEFTEPGEKVYSNIALSDYVSRLEETACYSTDGSNIVDANLSDIYSNSLTLSVENETTGTVDVKVIAEIITFNEILEGILDNAETVCEISNKYIQTKIHAQEMKSKLDKFISTKNQYYSAETRFNPLIQLSWLVNCNHADYDVNVDAYVVEQTLEVSSDIPAGRQTLMLLNKEAIL